MKIRDRVRELRRVRAGDLIPNPLNWRKHPKAQQDALRGVLAEIGFAGALLARETEAGLQLIDGHLRAETTPDQEVPVLILDVDESEAKKLLATVDPLAAMAETDDAMLASLLKDVETDSEAVRAMLDGLVEDDASARAVEEDDVPEPPADPITKPGDLWLLGEHRLLCGDSTKTDDVERLMSGEKAALVIADPPYFQKVDADWDNDFDGYEGFLGFLSSVFELWEPILLDRGTSGWWCAPDFAWHIEQRLRERFAVFNHIVWHKGAGLGTTVSVDDMRRWRPRSERLLLCEKQHSPDALLASFNAKTAHIAARSAYSAIIDQFIAWRKESGLSMKEIDDCLGTKGMAGHYFGTSQWSLPTREAWDKLKPLFSSRGVDIGEFDAQRHEFDAQRREFDVIGADQLTDVWAMSTPGVTERHGHPTPKPVALIAKLVSAHSRNDDLVADPFLGSGTTLIAAEQLGRKCYGMEISPQYCDVIVKRWETLTGRKATRESDGR
jgi:DNA modification methylase